MSTLLIAGDKISRPKVAGFVKHIGIYLGNDQVFHNSPERGEHVSTLAEFAAGPQVLIEHRDPHVNMTQVNWRVQERLQNPKPYHWSDYNCEHAITYVLNGEPESVQLQGWAAFAAGVALIAMLTR